MLVLITLRESDHDRGDHQSVPEKRTINLTSLARRFQGKVKSLTVEMRSTFIWTPYVSIDDYPYTVLKSSTVLPPKRSQ